MQWLLTASLIHVSALFRPLKAAVSGAAACRPLCVLCAVSVSH